MKTHIRKENRHPIKPARGAVRLVLCLLPLLIAGCASTANQKWNSRVGSYTVTQALTELGPPQSAVAFHDGVQVAEWLTRFGTRTSLQAQSGPTFSARVFDYSVLPRDAAHIPDKYLRLLFGPDGKLIAWDRQYR
ncbi:MAG: hypothetical protein JWR69_1671 [Pedosphaera sp.]|nr:hypothetical protein [Pedosphaera sp.]